MCAEVAVYVVNVWLCISDDHVHLVAWDQLLARVFPEGESERYLSNGTNRQIGLVC